VRLVSLSDIEMLFVFFDDFPSDSSLLRQ